MTKLKDTLKKQSEELLKVQKERSALMETKRQRALATWLIRPPKLYMLNYVFRLAHRTLICRLMLQRATHKASCSVLLVRSHFERIEHYIESMVKDPSKELQLADAVNRRCLGIRSSMPHDNEASSYTLDEESAKL